MADNDVKVARLADGFNLIARDFDRALRYARFDPLQRSMIDEARELSWTTSLLDGSREPKPFRFKVSALARILECSRTWLTAVIGELVCLKVLLELEGGDYLINKDFRDWMRRIKIGQGEERLVRRLTDLQIEECLAIRRRAKTVRPGGSGVSCAQDTPLSCAQDTPLSCAQDTPVLCTRHPLSCAQDTPERWTRQCTNDPPTTPSKEDPRPESSRESLERENSHTHHADADAVPHQVRRPAEDRALVDQACAILAGDQNTQHLAIRLGQLHQTPALLFLAGWRFVVAANVQLGLEHKKKLSWEYFVKVATNLPEEDRPGVATPATPGRNGDHPAPPPSKAELRRRKLIEGIRRMDFDSPPAKRSSHVEPS